MVRSDPDNYQSSDENTQDDIAVQRKETNAWTKKKIQFVHEIKSTEVTQNLLCNRLSQEASWTDYSRRHSGA